MTVVESAAWRGERSAAEIRDLDEKAAQVLATGAVSVDVVSGQPTDLRPPWDFLVGRLPDEAADPPSARPSVSSLTFATEG